MTTQSIQIMSTAIALAFLLPIKPLLAVDDETMVLEEVIVTSRKREESLMDVPDSVTAFSATMIENAGIDEVQKFFDMVPNLTIRETFRAGVTFISMRGITTAQQGWAPVTFVVDGAPVGAIDFINQGALNDIERIEVLRGPQGALYGAGAIAGAINIVTRKPTNELEYAGKASYASGNDFKFSGAVSGPIVEDKLLFRLNAYYRNSDGTQDSTDGVGLNFEEQKTIRGRLIYQTENLSFDLRASYSDIHAGAAMQEIVSDIAFIDEFDTLNAPGPARGIIGFENREFSDLSAKIDWQLNGATLTSITGYNNLDQDLFGSISWQKPPALSFIGPVGGPDDFFNDAFQDLEDNFEVFTQDLRIMSSADQRLRWIVGASYLWREVVNVLDIGGLFTGFEQDPADLFMIPIQTDLKHDKTWGIYGQASYDISDRLELTLTGRYDENNYNTSQCANEACTAFVPTPDGIETQKKKDSDFQPKIQLSYDWSDTLMTYLTFSEGFRFGFFTTGNSVQSESTKNYEVGLKSDLADRRLQLRGALFHIDYSDQQQTSIVTEPPFRVSRNIPETDINGFELEAIALVADGFTLSGGLGLLDTEIADGGGRSPGSPEITVNLAAEYQTPISDKWEVFVRADYRHQGDFLIDDTVTVFTVPSKDYVNARLSFRSENYTVGIFANNLFDERQATDLSGSGSLLGITRSFNSPRSVGIEVTSNF